MKILYINSFGYEAGGAETSIKILTKEFIKKGHTVKILSSDSNNNSIFFSDYQFKHPENKILQLIFRLFNPYSFSYLKKILKEFQPDIVHLHRMDFVSPSVLFLLKKYPTLMTLNGPEDFIKSLLIWFMPHSFFTNSKVSKDNLNLKGKFHYFYHSYIQLIIYKLGLKNVNLFITPSKYFLNTVDKFIQPKIVNYYGIKLLNFHQKKTCDYQLLVVGRIDKTKGMEYAIKSLPIVLKKFPKTKLTIIGEGIYKNTLVSITNKLNLQNNVIFEPWQKSELIEKYYLSSDTVIVPSVWPEAFGLVGPEAMSAGRPVIASRVGGIPEWLEDGKTGYLVDPKNEKQIAEKIIKLFSDKKLLRQMGENARKKAEEFSIESHINNTEKIYSDLLNNKKNL